MILAVHDAYVFEAPLEHLQEVCRLNERTMIDAVRELFPCLKPKVDVNSTCPECWNKDGNAQALEQWLRVPLEVRPSA